MEDMKIYILAPNGVYQSGVAMMVGGWFKLPVTEDEIRAHFNLDISFEDVEIVDYDLPFDIRLDGAIIEEFNDIYRQIEKMEPAIQNAISDLVRVFGSIRNLCNNVDSIRHYPDCNNMSELAKHMIESGEYFGELPHHIRQYINCDKLGNTLAFSGNYILTDNGIFYISK